jgi:polysaccharide biosynthesis transport protein
VSVGQILLILFRRGWIAILSLLTALGVALGILMFTPNRYDAIATATLDPGNTAPVSEAAYRLGDQQAQAVQGNIDTLVASHRVALDVVKRLNLTANPAIQANYRNSSSFGRESIDDWMAANLSANVIPGFTMGTTVLQVKYKSADPNQAALVANAFLASTIDQMVAMKASAAEQIAAWFAPQLDELRKERDAAIANYEDFITKSNPAGGDIATHEYEGLTQTLASAREALSAMQSRLEKGGDDLQPTDASDPEFQTIAGLKQRLAAAEETVATAKSTLGAANPKMVAAQANITSLRKQIAEATKNAPEKMRQHFQERVAQIQAQVPVLEGRQAEALKKLLPVQAQRDRLGELQRDITYHTDQLNLRERAAAQAKMQSKLTFSDITVLDKATPPLAPAFPKPWVVIPVAIGAGLSLGLILALLAEAADRRVRFPIDLEHASAAAFLGSIDASKRSRPRLGAPARRLASA